MVPRQLFTAFLFGFLFSLPANGDTEMDHVRTYAPHTQAIDPRTYSSVVENLRWRQTQDEALRWELRKQLDEVEKRFAQHDAESQDMEEVINKVGFVPDGVDGKLTSRCLEELLAVELEIATSTEMIKATIMAAEKHQADDEARDRNTESASFAALAAKRDLLTQQLRRAEEMVQKGFASQEEILSAKANLASLEAEQAVLKNRMNNVPFRSRYADQVTDLRIKIASLKARKSAVEKFLGRITDASKFSRQLKRLDRTEREIAARKIGINAKMNEIDLRMAETKSLTDLLQREIKKLEESKDASSEADK